MPLVAYVEANSNLYSLSKTYMASIRQRAQTCGYTDFLNTYLSFPPKGPLPAAPSSGKGDCDIWEDVLAAVSLINPCFNMYQIATTCPLLWDVLGMSGSFDYIPKGPQIYFDRADVKQAINAPPETTWRGCAKDPVFVGGSHSNSGGPSDDGSDNGNNGDDDGGAASGDDPSTPSGLSVLPGVIEKSQRTVIAHGSLDSIYIANGTL